MCGAPARRKLRDMSALTAGDVVYPGLAVLPGLEQIRALVAGRAPAPPVARLTGRRLVDASAGSATCTLPATAWALGPRGVVHPGLLAFVADGAAIATVVSALPPRVLCTTAELSLTFLGPPPPAGGVVTARGELMHLDDVMALVEIHVRDANDRLVAHGTSRCSVFSPIADSIRLLAPAEPAPATQPDPYERPAPPQAHGRAPAGGDGLGRLRARLRGELSSTPVDQLTGMRLVTADPGRVVFALAANPWLRNEWGTVYGGMLTLLAKSAAAAAAQTTAPAGTGCNALDIKINFLRPVPADGRDIVATGTVLHRGKRLAIATSELTHGDLRVAVLTGSTALTPP
jgi:uncharacterized protein (TIGR00369 family)